MKNISTYQIFEDLMEELNHTLLQVLLVLSHQHMTSPDRCVIRALAFFVLITNTMKMKCFSKNRIMYTIGKTYVFCEGMTHSLTFYSTNDLMHAIRIEKDMVNAA